MTAPEVTPDQVPDELIEVARQAFNAAPQKRDGKPTRMRYALAAVLTALAQQDEQPAQQPAPAAGPPWPGPRITLLPNGLGIGVHQLLVEGRDVSSAVRRARLRIEPGCWPLLDLELHVYEHGSIDADGVQIILPPETVHALQTLGWTPPKQPEQHQQHEQHERS